MEHEDELDRSAAFDESLRRNSSHKQGLEAAVSSNPDALEHALAESPKGEVIRLLHEVFRSAGTGPEVVVTSPPERIGRFTIERLLGRGAFGAVYLAHDSILHRVVALKVIHAHLVHDPSVRRRVLREREVMARLQHPNIVPVWEAGEESELLYIVSEYCPGPTLATWLEERDRLVAADPERLIDGSTEIKQSVEWIMRLADAVQHSHDRGIIHRDLKPGNVLLEPCTTAGGSTDERRWSPRLSDFGLAKYFDSVQDETRTGLFVGSLGYASPEQVRGQSDCVGPASDTYALGVLLFEMLTGTLPHQAASDYQLAKQICEHDVAFTAAQKRRLPYDLHAVALRALQRRPENRYRSAGELRDDLQRFLNDQFVLARPVPFYERSWRWARLHPGVASLASLCIALAILWGLTLAINNRQLKESSALLLDALIVAREQGDNADAQRAHARAMQGRAEESEQHARQVGYNANMRLAFEAWEKNNLADTRSLLDRVAEQSPTLVGLEWVLLSGQLDARYRRFATVPDATTGIVHQRNQNAVVTISAAGALRWWDLTTYSMTREVQVETGAHALAISPDQSTLALPYKLKGKTADSDSSSVQLWQRGRTPIELPTHYHDTSIESLEFSPDGQWIASGPRYEAVIVSNLRSEDVLVIPTSRRNRQVAFSPTGDRLAVLTTSSRIEITDLSSKKTVCVIKDIAGIANALMWLPGRELLAVASGGTGSFQIFSTEDGTEIFQNDTYIEGETISVSADGQTVALCTREGRMALHKIPDDPKSVQVDALPARILTGFINAITSVGQSKWVAADEDGGMIWLDENGQSQQRWADRSGFWCTARWEDESTLTVFSQTKPAIQFHTDSEASTGIEVVGRQFEVKLPIDTITSADGLLRASYTRGGQIGLSRTRGTESPISLQAEVGNVQDGRVLEQVVFSPNGQRIIATGANNRLTAWSTADGSIAWSKLLTDSGNCLAQDPATNRLFVGGGFEGLYIYDVDTGELLETIRGTNNTHTLLVDPVQRRLISGHGDGTLRIRDLSLSDQPIVVRASSADVQAITQSRDGRTLITGDELGDVRLWQRDGQPYGLFYHSNISTPLIRQFVWSPSGQQLAIVIYNGSGESEIVCWKSILPGGAVPTASVSE